MKIKQSLLALIAAIIWGTAFVAQSVSAETVPPFAFNAARAVIAFITLLIACAGAAAFKKSRGGKAHFGKGRDIVRGGICCGTLLFIASNLQQAGLADTSAGKAGFITALYVVLVPVFGLFLRRKVGGRIWLSVAAAVAGLYLLCVSGSFALSEGDAYLLLCAGAFAMQIMCVDHFAQKVEGMALSCAQFFVTGVLSLICSLIFENASLRAIWECILPILYVGVFSSGVAYTLQIMAQRDSDPAVISIILSLESVVSVIAGAMILHDRLSGREYAGCVLMFAAVILAQIPIKLKRKRKKPMA